MSLIANWIAFFSTLYAVSSLLICLRLYLRHRHGRFLQSDWLTALCLVLSTIMLGVAISGGYLNFTVSNLQVASVYKSSMTLLMFEVTAVTLVPLSKCSVTLLLLEVEVNRRWRLALQIMQALILIIGLVNVALNFFSCWTVGPGFFFVTFKQVFTQIAKNQVEQKHCVVRKQWITLNGALNVVSEIGIFVCAMSLVLRMRSTAVQKIGLAVTFGLGVLTVVATVMNAYVSYDNYIWETTQPYSAEILTSQFYKQSLWVAIEAYTGLLVGSLLPIRASIQHFLRRCLTRIMPTRRSARDCRDPEISVSTTVVNIPDKSPDDDEVSDMTDESVPLEHVDEEKSLA